MTVDCTRGDVVEAELSSRPPASSRPRGKGRSSSTRSPSCTQAYRRASPTSCASADPTRRASSPLRTTISAPGSRRAGSRRTSTSCSRRWTSRSLLFVIRRRTLLPRPPLPRAPHPRGPRSPASRRARGARLRGLRLPGERARARAPSSTRWSPPTGARSSAKHLPVEIAGGVLDGSEEIAPLCGRAAHFEREYVRRSRIARETSRGRRARSASAPTRWRESSEGASASRLPP